MGPIMSFPLRGRKAGVWASMGPGCFYPGNRAGECRAHGGHGASMGPGCFYPGNPSVNPEPVRLPELQWGRDVSIPEIRPPAARPAITSMASMGPGCFYPGNSATAAATYGMWALQWGRDVSIPEIPTNKASSTQAAALQWGRDVSIPEIATHYSILFSRTYAP